MVELAEVIFNLNIIKDILEEEEDTNNFNKKLEKIIINTENIVYFLHENKNIGKIEEAINLLNFICSRLYNATKHNEFCWVLLESSLHIRQYFLFHDKDVLLIHLHA